MDQTLLLQFAQHCPTTPWRVSLRKVLFARTHRYIEDARRGSKALLSLSGSSSGKRRDDDDDDGGKSNTDDDDEDGNENRKHSKKNNKNSGIQKRGSSKEMTSIRRSGANTEEEVDSDDKNKKNNNNKNKSKNKRITFSSHPPKPGMMSREGDTSRRRNADDEYQEDEDDDTTRMVLDEKLFQRTSNTETTSGTIADVHGFRRSIRPLSSEKRKKGGGADDGEEEENDNNSDFDDDFSYSRDEDVTKGGKKAKKVLEKQQKLERQYNLLDSISFTLVILNAFTLMMWDPLNLESTFTRAVNVVNNLFAFVFMIEIVLRVCALGFIVYRIDKWYAFDLVLVIIGVISALIDMITSLTPFSLNTLRVLRTVVLLRTGRTFETLRILVETIISSIRQLRYLLLLFLVFLTLFGIASVSQYSSRLRTRCVHRDYFDPVKRQMIANRYFNGTSPFVFIEQFVHYNDYDTFINYDLKRTALRDANYLYACQGIFNNYTSFSAAAAGRSLASFIADDPSGCATNFSNTAQGIPPAAALFPFQALVSAPPKNISFYALNRTANDFEEWRRYVWADQTCDPTNSLILIGFRCPYQFACTEIANPSRGYVGFDNLGQAMLTLFTVVTLEGWHNIMIWLVSGVDITAALFVVAVVVVGSLFIVNLTIVVLTIEYERGMRRHLENQNKVRRIAEEEHWVWRAHDAIVAYFTPARERTEDDFDDEYFFDDDDDEEKTLYTRLVALPQRNAFKIFVSAVVLTNVVLMAAQTSESSTNYEWLLTTAHYVFLCELIIELLIRFSGSDIYVFGSDILNLVDVLVFFFAVADVHSEVNFRPIMAMRIGRIVALLAGRFGTLRRWLHIVLATLKSSIVVCCFLVLAITIFGVLGLYLFGGTFCNLYERRLNGAIADNSAPSCQNRPRENYDNIGNALLTVFSLVTMDNWQSVMYNGMESRGALLALYFVAVVIIGRYLIVNLLIGIFLAQSAKDHDDGSLQPVIELTTAVFGQALGTQPKPNSWNPFKRFAGFFSTAEESHISPLDPKYSRFQLKLQQLVESSPFKWAIIVMIFISCACVALESPTRAPDTKEESLLFIADLGSNIVFTIEALLKIIAYGFVMGPQTYIRRDKWNLFDFLTVLVSYTSAALLFAKKGDQTQPIISAFRVLRAMRPLRFVNQSSGLRVVINTISLAVQPIFFLVLMLMCFATLWGVMGVQWFAGTFGSCPGNMALDTKATCLQAGHRWIVPFNNFDNIGNAYLSLMALSSMESWADIMYHGMDAVSVNVGPQVNHGRRFGIYFCAFVAIGGLYFISLFIAVIVQSYRSVMDASKFSKFLTVEEEAWVYTHFNMLAKIPLVDYDDIRSDSSRATRLIHAARTLCRLIVRHPLFEVTVYCAILVSFFVAAIDHYPKSNLMAVFILGSGVIFSVAFCFEIGLRIFAEGFSNFYASRWNRFDFFITGMNMIAVIFEIVFDTSTFVASFRTLRVLRLLRLLRKSRQIQSLLKRILLSLYSLKNTAALLFLIFFIFGVMGIRMFGRVQFGEVINHNSNFLDITGALMIVFRCATGGEWMQLVQATAPKVPDCDPHIDGCGNPIVSQVYFLVFQLTTQYIVMNIFIAVIFDTFTELDKQVPVLTPHDASQLIRLWTHFDPEKTLRIDARYLISYLRYIDSRCILSHEHEARRQREALQHQEAQAEAERRMRASGTYTIDSASFAKQLSAMERESQQQMDRDSERRQSVDGGSGADPFADIAPFSTTRLAASSAAYRNRLKKELQFLKTLDLVEVGGKIELQDILTALSQRAYQRIIDRSLEEEQDRLESKLRELLKAREKELLDAADLEDNFLLIPPTQATTHPQPLQLNGSGGGASSASPPLNAATSTLHALAGGLAPHHQDSGHNSNNNNDTSGAPRKIPAALLAAAAAIAGQGTGPLNTQLAHFLKSQEGPAAFAGGGDNANGNGANPTMRRRRLPIETERRLQLASDRVFRRNERDFNKPSLEETPVSKRFAVSIIEHYFFLLSERNAHRESVRAQVAQAEEDMRSYQTQTNQKLQRQLLERQQKAGGGGVGAGAAASAAGGGGGIRRTTSSSGTKGGKNVTAATTAAAHKKHRNNDTGHTLWERTRQKVLSHGGADSDDDLDDGL